MIQDAAVLIPVYRTDDDLWLVLVRRSAGGNHGGQLAFPGGKRDLKDRTLLDTALREAKEEIGLNPESVVILDQLPLTETKTTGFRIHPFLARIVPPDSWRREAREIAEVIEVRGQELARPEAQGEAIERFPTWPAPQKISFYRVGPYRLWGVTYRILQPILPRLLSGEWAV